MEAGWVGSRDQVLRLQTLAGNQAVKGAGYAAGGGPARKVGGVVAGLLVGALGAFSVGAVAGWGLIDYLFPPKASQATFDRVSALAAQYGLEFQIPDAGRTPWLEEE